MNGDMSAANSPPRGQSPGGDTTRQWARRARLYEVLEASDLRRAHAKRTLFQHMRGQTLFVGVGTGLDIAHFPVGPVITAIDISEDMLRRARRHRDRYLATTEQYGCASLELCLMDAAALTFADHSFDTVATACTLCSVADPSRVLRELRRVLRPGGRLLMFEHVRSSQPILAAVLDAMSLWSRRRGTDMSRETVRAVIEAGFHIERIESVFLDIILAIEASRPPATTGHSNARGLPV